MNVRNITSSSGGQVVNQFIIKHHGQTYFQSYATVIVCKDTLGQVKLDAKAWNCSKTTSRYRSQFLGETTKETQKKIDSGEYRLVDLNGGD